MGLVCLLPMLEARCCSQRCRHSSFRVDHRRIQPTKHLDREDLRTETNKSDDMSSSEFATVVNPNNTTGKRIRVVKFVSPSVRFSRSVLASFNVACCGVAWTRTRTRTRTTATATAKRQGETRHGNAEDRHGSLVATPMITTTTTGTTNNGSLSIHSQDRYMQMVNFPSSMTVFSFRRGLVPFA